MAQTLKKKRLLGLTANTGGGVRPPPGYGWVVYNDPETNQQRIKVFSDPLTGQLRPAIRSLN